MDELLSRATRVLREEGMAQFLRKSSRYSAREISGLVGRFGSSRECPICGFCGGRFKLAGVPLRSDVRCPDCGSGIRHRLLWMYIRNETDVMETDGRLLYFAPNGGIESKIREQGKIDCVTGDLQMASVDAQLDITRLPFEDGSFDTIVCSHVFEHVPDDEAGMSELYRVLKSGGDVLVLVPKYKSREETYEDDEITSPEERAEAFGRPGHVRKYGCDFEEKLSNAGFKVDVKTFGKELSSETVERMRLKDERRERATYDDIHHCVK